MAIWTIRHILTHRETSLARCLAARDNRLPVLVPIKGEHRLLPCVCLCTHTHSVCISVPQCVNVRREEGLWSSEVTVLPSASPCFAKHQKCYLKVLLWPFPARGGGELFTFARGLRSTVLVAAAHSHWGEPVLQGQMTHRSKQCIQN